jgi:UDP-N-acetylglucosamine--N-acetylmuramyl-(pentapeptide) pyrophosphoryl-undecaprenol N-acetylglucosamine transferase
MAGGTGGHIFPGLAVANEIRRAGWQAVWLGTRGGMETTLVPRHGLEIETVRFGGVRGKGLLTAMLLPLFILLACGQALGIMLRRRPDAVLGMGGFAAFPGGLMAVLLGRPLVVHEQNAIAGLTNKVLAHLADKVLAGFPQAFAQGRVQVETVGNPVRAEIAALPPPSERFSGRAGPLRLLVVGGSRGALALNRVVPEALGQMAPEARPQVHHQAGAGQVESTRADYAKHAVAAEVSEFIDDMAEAYGAADLLLCRAGALTIAELAAAGAAAILVPFPHAVDDHQTHNARYLSEAGAALLIQQDELTPTRLATELRQFERPRLLAMATRARTLARAESAAKVAVACRIAAGEEKVA